MSITNREVSMLLDYFFGSESNPGRVHGFWYSPKDAICEAIQTLGLDLSPDATSTIATIMTESVRLATSQSITQRKRSETRIARSIGSMRAAFQVQIIMHNVLFYFGVSLIAASVVFAFQGSSPAAVVIGGIGIFDLAIFFLKKPVEGLHESVGNLLQLRASYNAFFAELDQWQLYFDNLYGAQFLETKRLIARQIQRSTENTVQLIYEYTCGEDQEAEKPRIAQFFEQLRDKKKMIPKDSEKQS